MRVMAKAPLRPGHHELGRHALTCVVTTAALAATFWIGLIWLAERLI